jgi:hypothetical protein
MDETKVSEEVASEETEATTEATSTVAATVVASEASTAIKVVDAVEKTGILGKGIDLNTAYLALMAACLAAFLIGTFIPSFADDRLTQIVDMLKYFGLAIGAGATAALATKK